MKEKRQELIGKWESFISFNLNSLTKGRYYKLISIFSQGILLLVFVIDKHLPHIKKVISRKIKPEYHQIIKKSCAINVKYFHLDLFYIIQLFQSQIVIYPKKIKMGENFL